MNSVDGQSAMNSNSLISNKITQNQICGEGVLGRDSGQEVVLENRKNKILILEESNQNGASPKVCETSNRCLKSVSAGMFLRKVVQLYALYGLTGYAGYQSLQAGLGIMRGAESSLSLLEKSASLIVEKDETMEVLKNNLDNLQW